MRIQLSNNFYLDEFTRSQAAARHGIKIIVNEDSAEFLNLRSLARFVLQPIRDELGSVYISSGIRPVKVNKLIGSSKRSDHIVGRAADIVVAGYTPYEVAVWVRDNLKNYKQLIHEFGQWVHVSIPAFNVRPRNQNLTAIKVPRIIGKPKTVYVPRILTTEQALRSAA